MEFVFRKEDVHFAFHVLFKADEESEEGLQILVDMSVRVGRGRVRWTSFGLARGTRLRFGIFGL